MLLRRGLANVGGGLPLAAGGAEAFLYVSFMRADDQTKHPSS